MLLPWSVQTEESDPPPIFNTDAHDGDVDALLRQGKRQYDSGIQSSTESSDDEPIRLSNFADASIEAHVYAEDDECDGRTMHTVMLPDGTGSTSFVCAHVMRKGDGSNAGQLPTAREVLYYAAMTTYTDGVGPHKRPEGVSYMNKYTPTLVAAMYPMWIRTVTLLGHAITTTLMATSYTWSWGDGTPDLTTTSPGMSWQEGMDPNIDPVLTRHYYKAPSGWEPLPDGPYPFVTYTITLTITWVGTATNSFTGDIQTINGLITIAETTGPFSLGQLIVNNTDTSEEKQGYQNAKQMRIYATIITATPAHTKAGPNR